MGPIVEVDGKAVCFIIIIHVAEHVVVDVAEEVDFGLNTPVVPHVRQGRVFIEKTTVPSTHLVIGDEVCILNVLLL